MQEVRYKYDYAQYMNNAQIKNKKRAFTVSKSPF